MKKDGLQRRIVDKNTKQYINRMRIVQFVFLCFMCIGFAIFAGNIMENNKESLRQVALAEVQESMKENIDNLTVHIDTIRIRVENDAKVYLAELVLRLQNKSIEAPIDILNETAGTIENQIGNALRVLYTNQAGESVLIKADDRSIFSVTKEEKEDYIEANPVKMVATIGGEEIICFASQEKLDALVKEEIHAYIHAEHYAGNQYVWVNEVLDMEGGKNYAVRRIHPNLKDSEGEYLSTDMQDSVGNYPYQTELNGIRENGYVFHSYFFKNKTDDNVSEKFSYAVFYEPYQWIIATGETLEEVYEYSNALNEQNMKQILTLMSFFIIMFICMFGIMISILGRQAEAYRERMMKQSEILEDIYTTMSVGLLRVRVKGDETTLIRVNPKALELFGADTEEEFMEKRQRVISGVTDADAKKLIDVCKELKNQWDSIVVECYISWKDGSKHLLRVRNTLVDFEGDAKIIQRMCQDITEERRLQEEAILKAEEKATLDPMTQIKNKRAIEAITRARIKEAVEKNVAIAVGFVDIDNFRNYNTLYGHLQGDEVIKYVASVLKETIKGDVGRNGGDEFTFCMLDTTYAEVECAMRCIHEKLNIGIPVLETGEIIPTPCSIGVVIEWRSDMNYEELVKGSDEAMYQAKERGKNTYHILEK